MPTIAISNLKGGTTKTTTAIYLATALTELTDDTVTVLDLDPQGSATEWAGLADDNDAPLPFDVNPINARALTRLNNRPGHWNIIDCPPGASSTIDAALDASDMTIIPVSPSGMQADRMWATIDVAEARNTHARVLVTNVRPQTISARNLIAALDESDVIRCSPVIPQREAINASWGTVPGDLFGYDDLARELIAALHPTNS